MPVARFYSGLALIMCLGSVFAFGQQQSTAANSGPESDVKNVERDWLAADSKGDIDSLRRIIADDFVGSSFAGNVISKRDIIPDHATPGGFAGATPGETTARVFGDTGVLMGVINTAPAGGEGPQQIRVTLVCQKRAGGWQMVAAQLAH